MSPGPTASPAVALTSAVPAMAASTCTSAAKAAIDAAFTAVQTSLEAYWTEPTAGLANEFSKVPTINVINNSKYAIALSGSQTLKIRFDAIRAASATTVPNGPVSATTSWGSVTSVTTGSTVNGKSARTWTWTVSDRPLPSDASGNDNGGDMDFSTGTNTGGIAVQATLLELPVVVPDLDSIGTVSGQDVSQCGDYYASKVSSAQTVTITFAGPLYTSGTAVYNNDGSTNTMSGGAVSWAVGQSILSTASGNYTSDTTVPRNAGGISPDGIY